MKLTTLCTALFCTGSLLAVTAFGQQPPDMTPPAGSNPSMGSSTTSGLTGQMNDLRASKAIGAEVKTAQGEKLGKISDLILNPTSGKVDFAVLDWNSKLVPVPWQFFNASQTTGRTSFLSPTSSELTFTAQIDTSKLQSAPTIDKSRWTDIQQPGWSQKVYSYFGVQPRSSSGMGAPGLGTSPEQGGSSSTTPDQPKPDQGTPDTTPPDQGGMK